MHFSDNFAAVTAVMLPLNVAAAIFVAMIAFEYVMDRIDFGDDDDFDKPARG